MNFTELTYEEAYPLIQEGDILLFRPSADSWISFGIQRAGQGIHTHVGVATWRGESQKSLLEVVETREWIGARTCSFEQYVKDTSAYIDIFRPQPIATLLKFDSETKEVKQEEKEYDGRALTESMRKMTGIPYGWRRIWKIALHHMFISRLITKPKLSDEELNGNVYPVCSTLVACKLLETWGVDIVPFKSNGFVTPADLSRSTLLHYLFTVV